MNVNANAATSPNVIKPEPAPTHGPASRPVWPMVMADFENRKEFKRAGVVDAGALVLADMAARHEAGQAKYGTPLCTHNGRNALVDAYQEFLDGAVYLKQRLEELRTTHTAEAHDEWPMVSAAYVATLRQLVALAPAVHRGACTATPMPSAQLSLLPDLELAASAEVARVE